MDAGFRPILLSSHNGAAHEAENFETLLSLKPAGVLLAPLGRASDRAAAAAFCDSVPTVLFDSSIDDLGEAFIGSNNAQSIKLIVDYLCRSGEPPAFFEMREPPNPNALKRRQAYVQAMETLSLTPQLVQVEGRGWNFEEIGYREGGRVISDHVLQTNTVLCSNDRLAIGFLAAAYERGLRVGRGSGCALRIAGHDDHPFSRYTCPTLTTVAQNYRSIAQRSVETLLGLIESDTGADSREIVLFDGELIMRDSA
jgi:DNA-binding LacI/PurR family transcriptional regulator